MTHDERFAEFVARREEERAAQIKVTWRKVSPMTGGGWSGLGPNGKLVYVDDPGVGQRHRGYEYGRRFGSRKARVGERKTLAQAKRAAEELFNVG